jgi:hypothetical protein
VNVAKHERNDPSAIVRSGLSQITRQKNVARQSPEDTGPSPVNAIERYCLVPADA